MRFSPSRGGTVLVHSTKARIQLKGIKGIIPIEKIKQNLSRNKIYVNKILYIKKNILKKKIFNYS